MRRCILAFETCKKTPSPVEDDEVVEPIRSTSVALQLRWCTKSTLLVLESSWDSGQKTDQVEGHGRLFQQLLINSTGKQ
jgi:hypothetical protein